MFLGKQFGVPVSSPRFSRPGKSNNFTYRKVASSRPVYQGDTWLPNIGWASSNAARCRCLGAPSIQCAICQLRPCLLFNFELFWPKVTVYKHQISPSLTVCKFLNMLLTVTVYCSQFYGTLNKRFCARQVSLFQMKIDPRLNLVFVW